MLMKAVLAGRGEIVKTVICGDNYISEHQAEVIPQILDIIREVKPDLVLLQRGPLRHSLRRAHGGGAGAA